ncbi:MAG: nuclear transport factor 2 family protein [Sphingomonadaceae bacterium]|nr:nuclear transport factor 2 family protein [Sphingomonadaceae bacterium]
MQVEDYIHIQALVARYSDAANRQDPVAMAAVYAPHGRLIAFGNEPYVGREKIQEIFQGSMGRVEYLTQICAAGIIDIQGDWATGRWTVTEFAKHKDGDKLTYFQGSYEDVMVRTPEGWLFEQRILKRTAQARFEAALRAS